MDIQKILAAVDHTLLRPEATWEEIRQICEDGVAFGCASVSGLRTVWGTSSRCVR